MGFSANELAVIFRDKELRARWQAESKPVIKETEAAEVAKEADDELAGMTLLIKQIG